jgi:ABC-2 type transport system ATP-binding protein
VLTALPEVARVERSGQVVVVTGNGNLLGAVSSVLARHQIVANDLRIDQARLDDAFIAITGRLSAQAATAQTATTQTAKELA